MNDETIDLGHNRKAEDQYRIAWEKYKQTYDDAERIPLEREMDQLQPLIAVSPMDPRWKEFIVTLDGYIEYWEFARDQAIKECIRFIREST